MPTHGEIRKNRIKKLKAIEAAGILAYPSQTKRSHPINQVVKDFGKLARGKKEMVLVGRIRLLRVHGGSTFLHIEDGSGSIQAFFRKDKLGEKGYQFFLDNFDLGDFIEVRGTLMKTKKGEKTIKASDFKMLAKSLRPLPEKWHGIRDVEERFRKRYLDLIFNPQIRKKFETRSQIIRELRAFFEKEGFLEVETPILQTLYGGAAAKPFKTHLNALNLDLYLRISLELYLKRLLVGGFEKIYEIGKCFRNEGIDRYHNPDFTMLEFYWAYADYKELMKLTEKLFTHLIKKILGKLIISYEGRKIDFKTPWPRIEFSHLFRRHTKIDFQEINKAALAKKAQNLGISIEKGSSKTVILDEMYKKICRPKIIQPTFVIHYPVGFQTLAKSLETACDKLANFQLVAGGMEICNAFSELNDPIEQTKRFQAQENLFRAGFKEAQRIDEQFLEALEYGMPPAAGLGMGIDRLVSLLTDSHSLREVILFPTMKPR